MKNTIVRFGKVPSTFATVKCIGNETLFSNCTHNLNGRCYSRKGAGVICADGKTNRYLI